MARTRLVASKVVRSSSDSDAAVDHADFIRKLPLPAGFQAPRTLTFDDVIATAITREDLQDDVRGINTSLELIPVTRGGDWPTGPVTDGFNYDDLVWHEVEFRNGDSFTYVLRAQGHGYIGCCYLYPMGRRTTLTAELAGYDVDASWWVTPDAYAGYYGKVHKALRRWTVENYPFTTIHFSNVEIPTA